MALLMPFPTMSTFHHEALISPSTIPLIIRTLYPRVLYF